MVARDNKTSTSLDQGGTSLSEMFDSQNQLYAWGVSPRLFESFGHKVRATGYDRTRSVKPKTPQLTATGTLSKSITDYDLKTYTDWAHSGPTWGEKGAYYVSGKKAGEPKFGQYVLDPAVVATLSERSWKSKWFIRTLTPLNLNVIRAHLQSAQDTVGDLRRTFERVNGGGNRAAARNLTSACKWCDFNELCRTQLLGGDDAEYDLEALGLQSKDEKKRVQEDG